MSHAETRPSYAESSNHKHGYAKSSNHRGGYATESSNHRSSYAEPATQSYDHRASVQSNVSEIPLTGDAEADADIMAFVKARQAAMELGKM